MIMHMQTQEYVFMRIHRLKIKETYQNIIFIIKGYYHLEVTFVIFLNAYYPLNRKILLLIRT